MRGATAKELDRLFSRRDTEASVPPRLLLLLAPSRRPARAHPSRFRSPPLRRPFAARLLRRRRARSRRPHDGRCAPRRAASGDTTSHKSVIMVYLPGGPSHIDMFDMKPDAPAEIRGEFKPIKTNVPGVDMCELLPLHAKIADKFSVVNGLQCVDTHSAELLMRGHLGGPSKRPVFGSVVSRLRGGSGAERLAALRRAGRRERLRPRRPQLPRHRAPAVQAGRRSGEQPEARERRDAGATRGAQAAARRVRHRSPRHRRQGRDGRHGRVHAARRSK